MDEVRWIARNQSQRALPIERLKTIEELTGDFQIEFHSKPNANQLVHFRGRSDSQGRRANTRDGKTRPFPDGQPADEAFPEIFILFNRANNARNVTASFDQDEFTDFAGFLSGESASDPGRVARQIQPWSLGGRAYQTRPDGRPAVRLIFAPTFWQMGAFELVGIDRQDRFGFLGQPFAFRRRLKDKRQNDREEREDGDDAEIEFAQFLFVDLAGEKRELGCVLEMSIHRAAAAMHIRE